MSSERKGISCRYNEWVFGAIGVGAFLIIVGAIFVSTPGLFGRIIDFLTGFTVSQVPNLPQVFLPTPLIPQNHIVVYTAAMQFSFVWAFFQIAILVLRFIACSPLDKKGEAISNIVFWLGTGFAVQKLLVETTIWFEYWGILVAIGGLSLIVRGLYLAVAGHVKYTVFR